MLTGNEFQTLEEENRKARDPNVKLWRGTESYENWMSAETSWVCGVTSLMHVKYLCTLIVWQCYRHLLSSKADPTSSF